MRELYITHQLVKSRLYLEYSSVFTSHFSTCHSVVRNTHKKIPGANRCRGFCWTASACCQELISASNHQRTFSRRPGSFWNAGCFSHPIRHQSFLPDHAAAASVCRSG